MILAQTNIASIKKAKASTFDFNAIRLIILTRMLIVIKIQTNANIAAIIEAIIIFSLIKDNGEPLRIFHDSPLLIVGICPRY